MFRVLSEPNIDYKESIRFLNPIRASLGDPYLDNVVLYLKGDSANNSTTIIDSSNSAKTITPYGNTKILTADYKYGGSSIYFDGTDDYCLSAANTDFIFGTGDFAVESWVNFTGNPQTYGNIICGTYKYTNVDNGWLFYRNASSKLQFFLANVYQGATTLNNNIWYHLACTRSGNILRMFVNGNLDYSSTVSFDDNYNGTMKIGTSENNQGYNGQAFLQGYIDSLRITKGVARYTANFNPETDTYLAY